MSKPTTLLARVVNCAAILVCCAAPIAAQQAQPSTQRSVAPPAATTAASPAPSPTTAATAEPDLSITANVSARELLFEVVPNPKVEFPGRPRRDTVWEAERTNLPPQVQPGVTYRDIGIRLKITSVFADIERIVAEALGEIPASDDDAPPETDSNENARPPNGDGRTTANEAAQPVAALPSKSSTQTSHAASPSPPTQTRRARVRSGGAEARRGRP